MHFNRMTVCFYVGYILNRQNNTHVCSSILNSQIIRESIAFAQYQVRAVVCFYSSLGEHFFNFVVTLIADSEFDFQISAPPNSNNSITQ